jgi:hypothetical protein
MVEIKSRGTVQVAGRGSVAIVNLSEQSNYTEGVIPVNVGDVILLDDKKVAVLGIEAFKTTMHPPTIKPQIGILYKKA